MLSDWVDTIFCEDCRTGMERIDAARTPLRQSQTDLTSYNASADALQTQSQIITKEDKS